MYEVKVKVVCEVIIVIDALSQAEAVKEAEEIIKYEFEDTLEQGGTHVDMEGSVTECNVMYSPQELMYDKS